VPFVWTAATLNSKNEEDRVVNGGVLPLLMTWNLYGVRDRLIEQGPFDIDPRLGLIASQRTTMAMPSTAGRGGRVGLGERRRLKSSLQAEARATPQGSRSVVVQRRSYSYCFWRAGRGPPHCGFYSTDGTEGV
jgi:hypothetical protein